MSHADTTAQETVHSGGGRAGGLFAVLAGAAAVALFVWYAVTSPPNLDRSVIGMNGFVSFAHSKGQDIQVYLGQRPLVREKVGLRVLPLYTPQFNLSPQREKAGSDEEKQVLRRMDRAVFDQKISAIPTLVVLPKWRNGAILLERLHPKLLVDLKSQIFASGTMLARGEAEFENLRLLNRDDQRLPNITSVPAMLYLAQTMTLPKSAKAACNPVLESGHRVLLAQCKRTKDGTVYWVLSDPDLLNNHGAGIGENFASGLALVQSLAGGKRVIVDQTDRFHGNEEQQRRDSRGRTLAELSRFFLYPFTYIWLAFLILTFFALWHAARRSGPIDDGEVENEVTASKATAIDANIGILRAAGNETALAKKHMQQRLDDLGADLLGTNRSRGDAGIRQLVQAIERRTPDLSRRLEQSTKLLDRGAEGSSLFKALNEFEHVLKEVRYAFGRSASPRR